MSNESFKVAQSAEAAEARINRGQEDIINDKKAQIRALEGGLHTQLENYKQMGLYEDVMEDYLDINTDPRVDLANMELRFSRMEAAENAQAGTSLNLLAVETINQLGEIKRELASSAQDAERLNVQVQREWEKYLPEITDPNQFSQTAEFIAQMGESMGARPKVEKLEAAHAENSMLMADLRKVENSATYFTVKSMFKKLSGGADLETIPKTIATAFQSLESQTGLDAMTKKSRFMSTFKASLDSLVLANEILTECQFSIGEEEDAAPEEKEAPNNLLSEKEMAIMLDVILHGVKNKSTTAQLLDTYSAIKFYTGQDELSYYQKVALAPAKGIADTTTLIVDFALDPAKALSMLGTAGKGLFDANTLAKISQMGSYGWEHSTVEEKMLFMNDLLWAAAATGPVGQSIMTGLHLVGGGVAKAAQFGGVAARLSGVTKVAALAANASLRVAPRLAQYGADASRIMHGLSHRSHALLHKLEHFAHQAHKVHEYGVHYPEIGVKPAYYAAKTAAGAMSVGLAENITPLPIYSQLAQVELDLEAAITHADTLGISPPQVSELQVLLREVKSSRPA